MLIAQALDAYLVQLQADGRSPHTVAQAKRHLRLFIASVGDGPVADVRPEDVARFLASDAVTRTADGRPRKPTSANALRSTLRCFFGYVHAAGHAPVNAGRLIRRARCPAPRPRAVPEAEVARLLAALDGATTLAERRDRVLVQLLLRAGLRIGSALALDVEDLDLDAGEVRLRRMKNGDEDQAFIPDETLGVLRGFLSERISGPVFLGASGARLGTRQAHRRLAIWSERAGIGPVSPHRLRHSFGISVYERTGDVLLTARAMCHRSVASTAVYARPQAARVRAAIG